MSQFELTEALGSLSRTPGTLRQLLGGASEFWATARENDESWNPTDIIAHMIHGENTDWVPRVRIILEEGDRQPFAAVNRFAHLDQIMGRSLDELLHEFEVLRAQNVQTIRDLKLTAEQLELQGKHPALGIVTLEQLLATWVVHDFNHLNQITRALAMRYATNTGPWNHPEYLSIFQLCKTPERIETEG